MGAAPEVDTSFRSALRRLDEAGRLAKIARRVDPELEVTGIMRRRDGGLALLFEDVGGHPFPVLGNFLASPANCEAAFGTDVHGIRSLIARGLAERIPPVTVTDAPCREVVHVGDDVDLRSQLPVLVHTEGDGGPYITAGVVIARDPDTGVHNASYHRLQVVGPSTTAIQLDLGRHLRDIFERNRDRGRPTPITVCIGTDLALLYTAATMGSRMPLDADELEAAGALRGGALPVVAGLTHDLVAAAESEIVLEGEISPTETVQEGPFGEFVGYASEGGQAPVVHFRALTHRRDPVYHAISGAGSETVVLRKYVLETTALDVLRAAVPIVEDVEMTAGGLYRFHIVLQVRKQSPQHDGLERNAMLAAFGALKDLDRVVVVDDDIDIRDPTDVEYALATRVEASRDLIVIPGARGHEYVRVSDRGRRAKLGIDATVPFAERDRFRRVLFADRDVDDAELVTRPGASRLGWLAGT